MSDSMKNERRYFLGAGLGLGLVCASDFSLPTGMQWRERVLHGFGTTLWLRAAHADVRALDRGLDAAVSAIRHVEAQMSLFDSSSALSRLNRDGVLLNPDAHLLAVLTLGTQVAQTSGGAFDMSVQPLWLSWDRAKRAGRLPSSDELEQARALVDWRAVKLTDQKIELMRPGMQLTLNGIAQGYAADLARETLKRHGIAHALLDTGEWAMLGRSPDQRPWALGIADSARLGSVHLDQALRQLVLEGDSVATSSDQHSSFSADRRHHHILSPHTGQSPPDIALVCVVAPSCALADALTKVLFVAGRERAITVARSWNVRALIVDKSGSIQSTFPAS
jgi:FAD:protein FMN transferase